MIYVLNNWKIIKVKFTYLQIKNRKIYDSIYFIIIIHDRTSTKWGNETFALQD